MEVQRFSHMLGGPGVLKVAQDLWGMNCKLVLQI